MVDRAPLSGGGRTGNGVFGVMLTWHDISNLAMSVALYHMDQCVNIVERDSLNFLIRMREFFWSRRHQ